MAYTATTNAASVRHTTYRALNQLASVLGGRGMAIATNDRDHDPIARIETMLEIAADQIRLAASSGDQDTLKGASRKAESLGSLLILAKGLVEVA